MLENASHPNMPRARPDSVAEAVGDILDRVREP
jgi:hypothetical protein